MWRRTYLLLLVIRVYFALSPSYLHPDENFQGPELFAGMFNYPMIAPPIAIILRLYGREELFVAIFPKAESKTARSGNSATLLYEEQTLTNLETLLVAWGLVLIRRIVNNKRHSSFFSHAVLAFIAVVGVFNRITFPAFLLFPGLQLLPQFQRKPLGLAAFLLFGLFFSFIAIYTDTIFYRPTASFLSVFRHPIITPLNNLLYNTDTANLAQHGLHPHYQHFTANLLQLLGPAYIAMIVSLFSRPLIPYWMRNVRALSALSATMLLSLFPHQEPRFLLPVVPLLLSCFPMRGSRLLVVVWVIFNAAMGFLMGVYHQGGVVPTQLAMRDIVSSSPTPYIPSATVFWWKTYSPPLWLLGGDDQSTEIQTLDLMGMSGVDMIQQLELVVPGCSTPSPVFLVAPTSATFLDQYVFSAPQSQDQDQAQNQTLQLHQLWSYRNHLNLDDMDFGDDGILPTLKRVVGRRGLDVWSVQRSCK
ncbi:CAZyme family GT22 [Penicillium roqueforti]|nr:CAZyme family GT22 [Penicillium roqueforti]